MHLSDLISNLEESATLAMAAKARELKSQGTDVISLSLGEPDFKTPEYIQQGAKAAIDEGKYFAYPPVAGYQDLREAISEKFNRENNIPYKPENIVVSNGAKQSIANTMYCLVNPGDEVIIFSPYWVSYSAIVQLAGGKAVYVKGGIDNEFKATAQQLEAAITPKTRAIIYSSPCNPTGSVFSKEELEAIADVVKQHDVMIISDEIYEYINYSGSHVSIASLPDMFDRTVTVNGFAKGFAMTGWRVGYIGAPVWLAKGCTKMQGQITSANSSISQRAALTALKGDLSPTREMTAEYLERRNLVYKLLNAIPGVKANLPNGAFYFFPDVSSYFGKSVDGKVIRDASDLCMYILEAANVSLVTGAAFGAPDCIRLSYAASREDLIKALRQVSHVLSKLS